MTEIILAGGFFSIVLVVFAICSILAIPMIWYHIGHVSRKMSKVVARLTKIVDLLEEQKQQNLATKYQELDSSINQLLEGMKSSQ